MNNSTDKIIEIDGINYVLNFIKAQTYGVLTPYFKKETGQYYKIDGYIYIIAQIDNHKKIALINIQTGSRWADGIEVENPCDISHKEWINLIGGEYHTFNIKKIENKQSITINDPDLH
jgi:hypothetical protein